MKVQKEINLGIWKFEGEDLSNDVIQLKGMNELED